jgi:hypothetical protein
MPVLDLEKTTAVAELLAVGASKRDDEWRMLFYRNVVDAALEPLSEQAIKGPDGFPYIALRIPLAGQSVVAHSVASLVEHCTEHGFGIVIEPQRDPPGWVFRYGDLWSLRAYGTPDGDPSDEEPDELAGPVHIEAGRQLMIGAPSEEFLPVWARRTLHRFLTHGLSVVDPRICLVNDPKARPPRQLALNLSGDSKALRVTFEQAMHLLTWFLPRKRSLIALPESALPAGSFRALLV